MRVKKTDKYKKVSIYLSGTIIILLVLLLALVAKIVEIYPIRTGLKGYFWSNISEEQMVPKYRANFDPNNEMYYIESTSGNETISQGTWEKYKDNIYILNDIKTEEVTLVVLLHDTFYYRNSKTGEVIEFVTDGKGQVTYFE